MEDRDESGLEPVGNHFGVDVCLHEVGHTGRDSRTSATVQPRRSGADGSTAEGQFFHFILGIGNVVAPFRARELGARCLALFPDDTCGESSKPVCNGPHGFDPAPMHSAAIIIDCANTNRNYALLCVV